MNNQEEFFATCSFCHKPKQLIVFDVEWKGYKCPDKHYLRGGRVWLCNPCSKNYKLDVSNHNYNLEVNKMCEVLDGMQ